MAVAATSAKGYRRRWRTFEEKIAPGPVRFSALEQGQVDAGEWPNSIGSDNKFVGWGPIDFGGLSMAGPAPPLPALACRLYRYLGGPMATPAAGAG